MFLFTLGLAAQEPAPSWLAAGRAELAVARRAIEDLLAAPGPRTVANTLEPFDEAMRHAGNVAFRSTLWSEVHPDATVREDARTCAIEVQEFTSELLLDQRVHDAIVAVDLTEADAETRRFAAETLRSYRRQGVLLAPAARERSQQLDRRSLELCQRFQQNIADDRREVAVTDAARLAGLPEDWRLAHAPDAAGVVHVTTAYPDYEPVMAYAADDALRHDLYVQFRSRGATNEPVLAELLTLRAEKARLLGFADWADSMGDDLMLGGGDAVAAFLARVHALVGPRCRRDYEQLLAQLRTHDAAATAVSEWQRAWLEREVRAGAYDVDPARVREYFPFEPTLQGLLAIVAELFDLRFSAVPDAAVWHPSVRVYDVCGGAPVRRLGRIWLDLHPRPHKYTHAAHFPLVDGIRGKQLPESVLVCNLPDPARGPALLEHRNVVTMFHEFGHLLHHVLGGDHRWDRFSGVATEQDFVEAPAQMFEEWARRHETLARFAKHWRTGEPIPADLVARLRAADEFGVGTRTAQLLFQAAISLAFHREDPDKLDQLAVVRELQARYTPFAFVEGTRFHTSFGHLTGYSSTYYTYLWSLAIAKDLLTAFDAGNGLMDHDVAARFREEVLAPGGTRDAADLVHAFLGRSTDTRAFEAWLDR